MSRLLAHNVVRGFLALGALSPWTLPFAELNALSSEADALVAPAPCSVDHQLSAAEVQADVVDWIGRVRAIRPNATSRVSAAALDAAGTAAGSCLERMMLSDAVETYQLGLLLGESTGAPPRSSMKYSPIDFPISG